MIARITKHLRNMDLYEDSLLDHNTFGAVEDPSGRGQMISQHLFFLLFAFLTVFTSKTWDFFSLSEKKSTPWGKI